MPKCKYKRGLRIKVRPVDDAARKIPCFNCENFGWDMPQCKECDKTNNYKWFRQKVK